MVPPIVPAVVHYFLLVAMDGTATAPGQAPAGVAVPFGTTIVTKEQFDTAEAVLAAGGSLRMVNGVLIPAAAISPSPPSLALAQASALAQIDAAAEKARALFVTPGNGQALEYAATAAEADQVIQAIGASGGFATNQATGAVTIVGPPAPADYPWLAAEQAARADAGQSVSVTLLQVAQEVQAAAQAWTTAGAAIKRTRRAAKLAVAAATTVEGVTAIVAGLPWRQPPPG